MRSEITSQKDIIDLDTYRTHKVRVPLYIREAIPTPKDAEEALNEVARHLLMAVRVITSRKN